MSEGEGAGEIEEGQEKLGLRGGGRQAGPLRRGPLRKTGPLRRVTVGVRVRVRARARVRVRALCSGVSRSMMKLSAPFIITLTIPGQAASQGRSQSRPVMDRALEASQGRSPGL